MITPQKLQDANAILDAYPATSSLVRLAELLSPAALIEPELLRHIRLDCVPEAPVDVEQLLWFSELIRSRGHQGITFTNAVRAVLRQRLKLLAASDPDLVSKAMTIMQTVHGDVSPVLAFEEHIAWYEVFDNTAELRRAADTLLNSLLAGRDGLDHWLARAWEGLPQTLRDTPAGHNLAQVAALRGADIETPEADDLDIGSVWHLLPLVPLYLWREGSQLKIGVPASEAAYGIRVPDTRPVVIEISWNEGTISRSIRQTLLGRDGDAIHVGTGKVKLRTLSGALYELDAVATGATELGLEIEILAANQGQSLLLTYGGPEKPGRILIDCGPENTYYNLQSRLSELPREQRLIGLLVLTHVDADRIGGAIPLLRDMKGLGIQIEDVWFNAWKDLASAESEL